MAALEKRAAADRDSGPGPKPADSLRELRLSTQQEADLGIKDHSRLLFFFGPMDTWGSTPIVSVSRTRLEEGLLVSTDGDASMRALVDASTADWPEPAWKTESLSASRAYLVARYPESGYYEKALVSHVVFKVEGDYMYSFGYSGPPDTSLEAIFRASADTATVKGYGE
jgi:hypothetical protein